MDLNEYTEMLRREVASVTRFGGEEFTRTAEMLADALESSVRLTLLEVLSAAAAGLSVNAWLVRAVSRALEAPGGGSSRTQRGPGIGSRFTGYARG